MDKKLQVANSDYRLQSQPRELQISWLQSRFGHSRPIAACLAALAFGEVS